MLNRHNLAACMNASIRLVSNRIKYSRPPIPGDENSKNLSRAPKTPRKHHNYGELETFEGLAASLLSSKVTVDEDKNVILRLNGVVVLVIAND